MKERLLLIIKEIWAYIRSLASIAEDTDSETTIANITKGVEFRADNVWVLFFAIIIASVGLNVNSTAVIIGAMLVSPLMGPIMGLGLSIGISDGELLRKSLKNLFIMIAISLVASSLYFLISPLSDAQSELLARTKPTIYDVFIAFFGGMAGILAASRKQEKVTVVSGVAIATALMPPLCTAGYGLGTGQIIYFFGAFYLFFINAFFIALATYLMVRYLQFPRKRFLDPATERKVHRSIAIFTVVVVVPSIFIAINVVRETSFDNNAIKYVNDIQNNPVMQNVQIISQKRTFSSKGNEISLSLIGEPLTSEQVAVLQKRMEEMGLKNTKLTLRQAGGASLDVETQARMLQDFIEDKDRTIEQKDSLIQNLRQQIRLEQKKAEITAQQLAQELHVLYPYIKDVSMAEAVKVDVKNNTTDTIPTLNINWTMQPTEAEYQHLQDWLKVRLKTDKLDIVSK
ncbi:MAG: TIGR00341 family protein [Paludibacteraceae bacterium]|nr:TIGR00341 family protein [Paludibacteraceae bacterium]MBR6520063.1 TIGR00341 family protein [Paludibacteraceae bacterium]